MSEVPNELVPDDTSEVGMTSGEVVTTEAPKRPWYQMDLFNTILLISFLLITLATMLMLWHLTGSYGYFWDAPWNV